MRLWRLSSGTMLWRRWKISKTLPRLGKSSEYVPTMHHVQLSSTARFVSPSRRYGIGPNPRLDCHTSISIVATKISSRGPQSLRQRSYCYHRWSSQPHGCNSWHSFGDCLTKSTADCHRTADNVCPQVQEQTKREESKLCCSSHPVGELHCGAYEVNLSAKRTTGRLGANVRSHGWKGSGPNQPLQAL